MGNWERGKGNEHIQRVATDHKGRGEDEKGRLEVHFGLDGGDGLVDGDV